jgi:hypothetical protein
MEIHCVSIRLSEWNEDSLVMIHWSSIGLASLIMTLICCSEGHGICRPQPLFFYLKNSEQETKFQRDPVSLIFLSSIVVAISILQIFIEIKKCKLKRVTEKAARDAEDAVRNINEARSRLQTNETLINNAEMNPPASSTPLPNQLHCVDENNSSVRGEIAKTCSTGLQGNPLSQDNAFKVARVIAFFAFLPAVIFIIIFTLENIDDWRPHGTTALTMIAFGIIIPMLFFIGNFKFRRFAISYVRNKLSFFETIFIFGRVEPSI